MKQNTKGDDPDFLNHLIKDDFGTSLEIFSWETCSREKAKGIHD